MDVFLIVVAILLLLIGIIGCIIPALPGVPLSYCGLILLQLTDRVQFTWKFLIVWAVIVIIVTVLDYIVPIWGTKKFGGSKKGVWGSTIGLLVGMFLGPWGIVLGPFVGAVLFELLDGKMTGDALKAGFGSFVGLFTGIILKLICAGLMTYYAVQAIF